MKTVLLLLSLLFVKDLSLSAVFFLPQLQSHRYLQKILRATSDENLIVQSSTTAEESSSTPPPIISESTADAKAVSAPAEPSLAPVIENIIRQPANTSFFMCSACKAAYLVADRAISGRGSRVRCKICEKDWFQTMDRTLKTDAVHVLETMSSKSMADLKRIIADKNWPRYSRAPKFGIFVGNLPYTYEEKDLIDLFAEYGVTQVSLVRDNEGQSKGFAFIEVRLLSPTLNEYCFNFIHIAGVE